MNATSPAVTASFWKTGLAVFFAVLLLGIPQAALLPLLDRDEPRFAEASREMLQSGNFIVPTFNGAPRYAKPPLIYWCQAISFTLFGQNAFAARLPSLIATAGTALILFWWGVRIGDRNIGLIAALSYAFCLQTMQQGRVATADALLIYFMTLTAYTGWNLLHHEPPPKDHPAPRSVFRTGSTLRAWSFRLVLALAAGFLAKGPEAWLPIVPLVVLADNWRGRCYFLLCFLYSLTLACIWGIPAYVASHGDYLRQGVSEGLWLRMIEGLQGHGASTFVWYLLGVVFFYPLFFLLGALPVWPLAIAYRKKLFASQKPELIDTYLLLNAGLIIIIFSLMVTKLPHYTLPAFPFLALWFARRWVGVGLSPTLPIKLGWSFGIILAGLSAIFIPVAIANHATPSPVGEPVRDAQADGALTPDTEFALVDFQEPNTIWEMRRVSKSYATTVPESDVISYLSQPGPRAIVISSSLWKKLSDGADPGWKTYDARGWNTAKAWNSDTNTFALIDLTLVVKK